MGFELKRRQAADVIPTGPVLASECPVFRAYPCLWEMLSVPSYSDGKPRQTATITVFCDAGVPKVCLNDRDTGLTAWASGVTVADALDALEAGLKADSLVWRRPGGKSSRKSGK